MTILLGIIFWSILAISVVITPMGLPGTFIIAAATLLYSILTDFTIISFTLVLVLFAIAIILEMIEFSLSGYMTNKFGGSRLAVIGAIVGGLTGAIWGTVILPIIGTLIGAFLGAFVGAFLGEFFLTRNFDRSILAGFGAFIGAVGGKTLKTVSAVAMVVTIGFYYF